MIESFMKFEPNSLLKLKGHCLFSEHFGRLNQLTCFSAWEYGPGMGFDDHLKWWGGRGQRLTPHEGVDLACFRDNQGGLQKVELGWRFPAIFPGCVVGVFKDFLGKSILFRHDFFAGNGWRLYSIFGHTQPFAEIVPGATIDNGQPVATLAEIRQPSLMAAHLHISLLWVSPGHEAEALDWGSIAVSDAISLIDPTEVI